MSSIVALLIGSTCNIWHKRLITLLFRYSGIGKMPAKTEENVTAELFLGSFVLDLTFSLTFNLTEEGRNMLVIEWQGTAE